LPPELMRKGRFDEIWFVDLPNEEERLSVLSASMRSHKRDATGLDSLAIANATEGFTGSEIAALIPDAMFAAFADGGREITTADVLTAALTVAPLSRMADGKIDKLRAWATGRARPASKPSEKAVRPTPLRVLDMA